MNASKMKASLALAAMTASNLALAAGGERQVVLDYLDDVAMRIALAPCR